jgi:predicted alpha/beta superfamily hydrolase
MGNLISGAMEKHSLRVWSPQLRNHRTVDVYLPRSYDAGRLRYPVVYMQDGQNLSDPSIAFAGKTWQLETALERLRLNGIEPLVVGIHHLGDARVAEYSPFTDPKHAGGEGLRYCRFVADTLKPQIDAHYRTRRDRNGTVVFGSSMGGLISLFAFFLRPSPFGRVGSMSPSIWFGGGRILELAEQARDARGRIYLDVGTAEGSQTVRNTRVLARILLRKGYQPRDTLLYVEANGQHHGETDWARRLPGALEFLLQ